MSLIFNKFRTTLTFKAKRSTLSPTHTEEESTTVFNEQSPPLKLTFSQTMLLSERGDSVGEMDTLKTAGKTRNHQQGILGMENGDDVDPSIFDSSAPQRNRKFRNSTVQLDPSKQFNLMQIIGEGSYGKVFKAEKTQQRGTYYAIKIVPIPVNGEMGDLKKEIDALKRASDSHFVVRYHGNFQYQHMLWIVMDLCDGGSVADILQVCRRKLDEREIREVTCGMLLGLQHLHSHNIIHRDIKCANVLLTNSGIAKLADFGVSAELTNTTFKRNTMCGTPYWMAPEVILENQYDYKCDVWSTGICVIEMVEEGHPPLEEMHPMRALFQIPRRPKPRVKHEDQWTKELVNFIFVTLEKDPAKRPSVVDMLQHGFISENTGPMIEAEGKSPVLSALAMECGPTILEHHHAVSLEAEQQDEEAKKARPKTVKAEKHKTVKRKPVDLDDEDDVEEEEEGVDSRTFITPGNRISSDEKDDESAYEGSFKKQAQQDDTQAVPDYMKYFLNA